MRHCGWAKAIYFEPIMHIYVKDRPCTFDKLNHSDFVFVMHVRKDSDVNCFGFILTNDLGIFGIGYNLFGISIF